MNAQDMRVGVRYKVTHDSKNKEFQCGDIVWKESDGSIMNRKARGWMPAEHVAAATEEWAIEVDTEWLESMREKINATLKHYENPTH